MAAYGGQEAITQIVGLYWRPIHVCVQKRGFDANDAEDIMSKDGLVAVVAPRGPVGLLQNDGTWKTTERELEALRHITWTPQGQLWMVGILDVSRCDAEGREVLTGVRLEDREIHSAFSPDGSTLAVGISGGLIFIFTTTDETLRTITPAIPAPLSALAIRDQAERVAAAWRSGDVWVQQASGTTSSLRVAESVLHLSFMPDQASLLVHSPASITHWSVSQSTPVRTLPLSDAPKTLLPLENSCLSLEMRQTPSKLGWSAASLGRGSSMTDNALNPYNASRETSAT